MVRGDDGENIGVDLDADRVSGVPHTQVPRANTGGLENLSQCGLGAVDASQQPHRDRRSVRHATGQTRGRRFVPRAQPHVARDRSNVVLRQPGFDHRKPRTLRLGGALARSVVAEVVDVDSENDHGTTFLCDGNEHVHQLVLAMKTTITLVGDVRGSRRLIGRNGTPVEVPFGGKVGTVTFLRGGERRRHCGDAEHVVATEDVRGACREEGRIGTTAERDHHPTDVAKNGVEGITHL